MGSSRKMLGEVGSGESIDRFSVRHDDLDKDRQGNSKQTWPYCIKCTGKPVCDITDKPVEGTTSEKIGNCAGQKNAGVAEGESC